MYEDPVKMQIWIQDICGGVSAPLMSSQVIPYFECQGSRILVKNTNSWVTHPLIFILKVYNRILNFVICTTTSKCFQYSRSVDYPLRKPLRFCEVWGQGSLCCHYPLCIKHRVWHTKCIKKSHLQNVWIYSLSLIHILSTNPRGWSRKREEESMAGQALRPPLGQQGTFYSFKCKIFKFMSPFK